MKPPISLVDLGRMPELDESMETLFRWLASHDLVEEGGTMDVPTLDFDKPQVLDGSQVAIAEPTARRHANRKSQKEMKALKERYGSKLPEGITNIAVWQAVKDPTSGVRKLSWKRLPADAMAFYRPFHFPPFDQWGIYLLVGPLLAYHERLQQLSAPLRLYSHEVLMHLVVFEIFNHEFSLGQEGRRFSWDFALHAQSL